MKFLFPHFIIVASSRALAIALTVFLFVVGSVPAAGQTFPGISALDRTLGSLCGDSLSLWSGLAKATGRTRCRLRSRAGRNPRIL